ALIIMVLRVNVCSIFGQEGVVFKDEADLEFILLVNDSFEVPHQWQHNAYSEIPQAYQILGIGPFDLGFRNAAGNGRIFGNCLRLSQKR
ncbi:hypothetical protein, partial [Escherichia coli]|uniref:hypothetical protein n=1 Tax=Escherichia coli TaxID=562 RepID=UPI001A7E5EDD